MFSKTVNCLVISIIINALIFPSSSVCSPERIRRASGSFKDDELGESNINELVDLALERLWPHFTKLGYTTLKLPNIADEKGDLKLTNGVLSKLSSLQKLNDVYMTLKDYALRFTLNLLTRNTDFKYDFNLNSAQLSGTVEGSIVNITAKADFSVGVKDGNLHIDSLTITSIGEFSCHANDDSTTNQVSEPVRKLLEKKLSTTISESIQQQLQNFLDEVNTKDLLELKAIKERLVSIVTGNKSTK